MRFRFFATLLFCFAAALASAQRHAIDSLEAAYAKSPKDTSAVNTLLALSKTYLGVNPDEAIRCGMEAKELSTRLHFDHGIALAYKHIGIGYVTKGMYVEALQQYELSLQTFTRLGDKKGMAAMLKNTGSVYGHKGDDDKALEYYLQALKLSEEIGDTLQRLSSLSNIGTIYMYKTATHDKAFQFLRQAYALCNGVRDNNSLGTVAVNLGELYLAHNQFDSALHFFDVSLKAFDGTADMAYTLNDIGKLYMLKKEFDKAINIQSNAIDIAKQYDAQDNVLVSLTGIAQSYDEQGNPKMALNFYQQAEALAQTLGAKYALVDVYAGLAKSYADLSDYDNAYRYQALLTGIKDTVYNLETDKKLGTLQFTYDLDKKSAEIKLLTKDGELKAKELSRQKMVRNGFMGGFAALLLVALVILLQRNRIAKEKHRSEALLLNILPAETAHELKHTGKAKAHRYESVSVLFTDFKGFSNKAETMSPEALVDVLDFYFRAFDAIVQKHGLEKIKTIGDAYMCACGLPTPVENHALKIIRAAVDIREFCAHQAIHRFTRGLPFFEIRIGVNTGPVVAGVVGESKFAYDIWGDTVNMAARMEQSGVPGKINISGTTYEAVKESVKCTYRGKVSVKHKDDVEMYFVDEEITESNTPKPRTNYEPLTEHILLKNAIQTKHKRAAQTHGEATSGNG